MDKYQSNLLQRGKASFLSDAGEEKIDFGEKVTLVQNPNYTVGNYKILINNPSVASVTYLGVKYISADNVVTVPFDFEKAGTELLVSFKNGLANDCRLELSIVLADKKAYDAKVASANAAQLKANVALILGKGINLLNVFWKKADESVTRSVVKICFRPSDSVRYPVLEKETNEFYLSVPGLAFGVYEVTVEEFVGDKLLVSVGGLVTLVDHPEELKRLIEASTDKLTGQVRASGTHYVCR